MNSVSAAAHPSPSSHPIARADKASRAAHQFEGVLLNTLLSSLEHSFSSLPGKTAEVGSDNYHYLGMQALASSLSARGGLGIADLILRNLRAHGTIADNSSTK